MFTKITARPLGPPAVPAFAGGKESRGEHRQRVLKRATIIIAGTISEVSCQLRNQHGGGAELRVGPDARVPARFLLYVPVDGVAYRAEVRWRRSERIGVQFAGSEPKPRKHYG